MVVVDELTARVRSEYREMPGMRLTFAQACRLWQMDATTCSIVLASLVAEGVLYECADKTYAAYPSAPRTPAKAALPQGPSRQAPARRFA